MEAVLDTKKIAKNSNKNGKSVFYIVMTVLLVIYSTFIVLPYAWALIQTFRTPNSLISEGPFAIGKLTFENYINAFNGFAIDITGVGKKYIESMFYNSIVYSVGCTLSCMVASCMVAYTIARFDYKFSRFIYVLVIFVMALPIVGNLPSEIEVAMTLGLYNKMGGMFIMKFHFLGGMYFLVLYESFRSIPKSYEEAAEIDGAGYFTVFLRIMLPMVRNVIGTIAVIYFVQFWNDYQTPNVYLKSRPTIAYGLLKFQFANGELATKTVQITACLFLLIPSLLVFLIFKDKFLGDLSAGGVKG